MKTAKIEVRLTPEEKASIEAAAEKQGMTVSDYIRSRIILHSRNILAYADGKMDRENILLIDRQNTVASTNMIPDPVEVVVLDSE